ncbi:FG-GAP repeat domain-containing protein [Nannocystaceae bacterium ST9]
MPRSTRLTSLLLALSSISLACSDSGSGDADADAGDDAGDEASDAGETGSDPPTAPACDAADPDGSGVAAPELVRSLAHRWHEGWLGSPAVADLDGDGTMEIVAARESLVLVWSPEGTLLWEYDTSVGRIWASPVVADLRADLPGLEVAVAARDSIHLIDASGQVVPGFPISWEDELRSLAVGDLDGDGELELVVTPGHGGPTDVIAAFHVDGSPVAGFPPNAAGTSGCDLDDKCYLAGCYDQNLALGDLDGDGRADIVAPHDNAYASIHRSTGEAFDAAPGFAALKSPGVRYMHVFAEAQQGYAEDEETALQAHFTNTAPAIADLDEDGQYEVVMLGSVQNAAQSDRFKGVALWAVRPDVSRLPGFESPVHMPDYLAGLWDYEGTNVVGATNQVSIADLDPELPGKEVVFAGFDGSIHAVSAAGQAMWSSSYTTSDRVLTGGVVIGDLDRDGVPEIVFASYSPDEGQSNLFVLDAGGNILHQLPLPRRGAMAVPTLADVEGDGSVEIVVSLKDAEDMVESVQVWTVPGSADNCLPWPTGRGSLRRDGWVVD